MAFHFQTFRTRAITAVLFVLVMLAGLLLNQWGFLLLFSLIHFGCWLEYDRLVVMIEPAYQKVNKLFRFSIMLMGWGFLLRMSDNSYHLGDTALQNIGEWLFTCSLIIAVLVYVSAIKIIKLRLLIHTWVGLVYISLSWGIMMRLKGNMDQQVFEGNYWLLPLIIIASIWINDTMAYLVGSIIGKTPLSPVSPKKTWEGTIVGGMLAVITVTLLGYYVFHFPLLPLVIVSATASISGTFGDLFESKLKRLANVKDSGSFLPGHGGFLDRFDSLLFATIAVYIMLRLFIFWHIIP